MEDPTACGKLFAGSNLIAEALPPAVLIYGSEIAKVLQRGLLDMNMPGMVGLEACRSIRSGSDIPVIILSVRSTEKDKVAALDAGADDYVTKPFGIEELLARIRAAMRRSPSSSEGGPHGCSAADLEIDFDTRKVRANGKDVRLTPKEFETLRYLVAHTGRPVTHRELLQAVWGPDYGAEPE